MCFAGDNEEICEVGNSCGYTRFCCILVVFFLWNGEFLMIGVTSDTRFSGNEEENCFVILLEKFIEKKKEKEKELYTF